MKIIYEELDRVKLASGMTLTYTGLDGRNYSSQDCIGTVVGVESEQIKIIWTTHDNQKIERSYNSLYIVPFIDAYEIRIKSLKERLMKLDKKILRIQEVVEC